MVLTEKVLIKVNNRAMKYYRNKGYICNVGDILEIKVEDLTKGSLYKIGVKCDLCGKEKLLRYDVYCKNIHNDGYYACRGKCGHIKAIATNLNKYGVKNCSYIKENIEKANKTKLNKQESDPLLSSIIKEKRKNTVLKRYGSENPIQVVEFFEKMKATTLKNHGVEYIAQNPNFVKKAKQTKIKNGNQMPDELKTPFELYRAKVDNLTHNLKNILYENWDGYDYYDNEYIKNNLQLKYTNKLYPTIDHKISVYYGFNNNISIEEIGSLSNLCITKRSINCIKHSKTEKEFKN